jgi:hypothetical protein
MGRAAPGCPGAAAGAAAAAVSAPRPSWGQPAVQLRSPAPRASSYPRAQLPHPSSASRPACPLAYLAYPVYGTPATTKRYNRQFILYTLFSFRHRRTRGTPLTLLTLTYLRNIGERSILPTLDTFSIVRFQVSLAHSIFFFFFFFIVFHLLASMIKNDLLL